MNDTNLSVNECNNLSSRLNIKNWRDNIQKDLKNAGKEYVSKRGRGQIVAAKKAPAQVRGCKLSCTKIGCGSLSIDYVHKLFTQFYELDYNGQTNFLLEFINIRAPKRRRACYTDTTSRKNVGFDYKVNGKAVCLQTLANIFSISLKRIRVLQIKLKDGAILKDKRGRHTIKISIESLEGTVMEQLKIKEKEKLKLNVLYEEEISLSDYSMNDLNKYKITEIIKNKIKEIGVLTDEKVKEMFLLSLFSDLKEMSYCQLDFFKLKVIPIIKSIRS